MKGEIREESEPPNDPPRGSPPPFEYIPVYQNRILTDSRDTELETIPQERPTQIGNFGEEEDPQVNLIGIDSNAGGKRMSIIEGRHGDRHIDELACSQEVKNKLNISFSATLGPGNEPNSGDVGIEYLHFLEKTVSIYIYIYIRIMS